jgi:serine/threonine-protein kinase
MAATPEFFILQEAVAGRYSIVGEIGRGGMGIVFLARDVALDRPVAIKMLPPDLAATKRHRERFLREARTAARLSHPHIVPIHSVEEHTSVVFFVMAFVDGETLGERVTREGPLAGAEALRIMQEVAWALAHAHASGVVHRDVKPDNILIERGTGRVLVTDFGIARAGEASDTSGEGRVVGTPRYMSPEQAAGDTLDARSDLYSLGAVTFFSVTGRAPHEGDSSVSVMAKVVTAPSPCVGDVRQDLPGALSVAIDRCLSKLPDGRFTSAEELAACLRSAIAHMGDVPAPVRAFARETEMAAPAIASLATATAVSLAGYTYAQVLSTNLLDVVEVVMFVGVGTTTAGLMFARIGQLFATARDSLRAGYGHSAVASGLLIEQQNRPVPLRRPSHVFSALGATVAAAGGIWLAGTDTWIPALFGLAAAIAVPGWFVSRLVGNAGPRGTWLSRLVRGRFGRLAFRLAGKGIAQRPQLKPTVGEPTAVALSHAVSDLFAALPESQRRDLAELPSLIARLEADAMSARGQSENPSRDERFTSTMAMLETLRLDLLRLHASAGSVDDLTRHLEAARRIGAEISLELKGRSELSDSRDRSSDRSLA